MSLRQKTKSLSSFALDKQSDDGLLSPLSSYHQPPSTTKEEFPIPVYQFSIEIMKADDNPGQDTTIALFQKISGMTVSRDVDPLKVGGENHYTREFPAQVSYSHVKFEAGLTSNRFFYNWMMAGHMAGVAQSIDFDLVQRRSNPGLVAPDPIAADTSGAPILPSPIIVEAKRWNFFHAFPVKWKISDLSIDNSKSIVIKSLELSFDYFHLATP